MTLFRILKQSRSAAFLALTLSGAWGADVYVSTNATPAPPYDSWANAFTSLQAALVYLSNGDTLYLAGHRFVGVSDGTNVFVLTNRANVSIRGGFKADPSDPELPGPQDPSQWPTVLARLTNGPNGRVLYLQNVTNAVVEGIIIRDGKLNNGAGVYLTGCTNLVFSSCHIVANRAEGGNGGGLYVISSEMTLTNCVVVSNRADRYNDGTQAYGAGAHIAANGSLIVQSCLVTGNVAHASRTQPSYGGAFYLAHSTSRLRLEESVVTENFATTEWAGGIGRGGAIANNGGTVRMRNVLVAKNQTALTATDPSSGIFSTGTTARLVLENCTIADNDAGKAGRVGIRFGGGQVAVSNCIVWGHVEDLVGFPKNTQGVLTNVWYSDLGDGQNAGVQGCHSVDPCFDDTIYYHLQSTEGCYKGGFFSGGTWGTSVSNSPLLDRGDPSADSSREPSPNGGRLNMGAYANTPVASKTPSTSPSLPVVSNPGALNWGHRSALVRGTIESTGGQAPELSLRYWMASGGSTSSIPFGLKLASNVSNTLSGLTPGSTYGYQWVASNDAGSVFSDVSFFSLHPSPSTLFVSTNGDHTAGTNWLTAYRAL